MRPVLLACAAAAFVLAGSGTASAGTIVYDIKNYPTLQNGFMLGGTITTDGAIGTLAAANITAWTITITSAGGSATTYNSTTPGNIVHGGADASATAITLSSGALSFDNAVGWSPLQYNRGGNNLYISKPDANTTNWFQFLGAADLGGDPWIIATAETSAVPEPASLTLLGIGIAGIAGFAWRRRKQPA